MCKHNQWAEFHRNNPSVFDLFKKYAFEMRDGGRGRYSAKTIIERMRWHTDLETTGDTFKLNNNHIPFYARLLIYLDPRFRGFFSMRRSNQHFDRIRILEAHKASQLVLAGE